MENIDKEVLEDYVYNNPLALLTIKDQELIDIVNSYIPYSTGFEIECYKLQDSYFEENFKSIPDIMEVRNDEGEQRYRIPNGLVGIICLYNISIQLKINSQLTTSGIHYHIGLSEYYLKIFNSKDIFKEYICSELDTWNYQGSYNKRESNWFRFNGDYKTLEFRVGEMTFDHSILIKRIIHVNRIVNQVQKMLNITREVSYAKLDLEKIKQYIVNSSGSNSRINKILMEEKKLTTISTISIEDRVKKLY